MSPELSFSVNKAPFLLECSKPAEHGGTFLWSQCSGRLRQDYHQEGVLDAIRGPFHAPAP